MSYLICQHRIFIKNYNISIVTLETDHFRIFPKNCRITPLSKWILAIEDSMRWSGGIQQRRCSASLMVMMPSWKTSWPAGMLNVLNKLVINIRLYNKQKRIKCSSDWLPIPLNFRHSGLDSQLLVCCGSAYRLCGIWSMLQKPAYEVESIFIEYFQDLGSHEK